ncbi:MAG: hypothetical protein HKP58_04160 [Desulfatitalea sp.]|nr:hypothetical protein [Desulfatitalea sp.]NNJ99586.1 hypothetical protein [Desulfatitalea sp.]
MIFGAELGLLIYGVMALIKGQFSIGKGKKVQGSSARVLGIISLLPMPLSAMAGFVIGFLNPDAEAAGQMKWTIVGVEVSILAGIVVVLMLLANKFYKRQKTVSM